MQGSAALGIITSGISFMHVREAAPEARVLKLGLTYPLPLKKIAQFVKGVGRCVVIEEGDPYLVEAIRAAGIAVEGKAEMYRFGELDVLRVRRILNDDLSPEPTPPPGKPPAALRRAARTASSSRPCASSDCIVAGDIGCYTLGVLQPFEAMDYLRLHGRQPGRRPGAAPRAAARPGPPRRQRHRRQHLRP